MLDTKGPEIRLGTFKNGVEKLVTGQKFTLTSREVRAPTRSALSLQRAARDVAAGWAYHAGRRSDRAGVDEVSDTDIVCTVKNDGTIKTKKGVNVPGVHCPCPMSNRDRNDILFGIEQGFDLISASFVRNAQDIMEIRHLLDDTTSNIRIIARSRTRRGIDNIPTRS